MPNTVKVQFQLIYLQHDGIESRNLGVGIVNDVSRPVILCHGHNGTLLAQVLDSLLDLLHKTVQVGREGMQTRTVQEQPTLRRRTACGSRGRRPCSLCLVVAKELDLFVRQAQLCIWDRVRLGRRHGAAETLCALPPIATWYLL